MTSQDIITKILRGVEDVKEQSVIKDAIDLLSTEARREIQTTLIKNGCDVMPRNLFYNYSTQEWI